MTLPLQPPVAPMLAKAARELPVADGMAYEPKWDGFRCIVFRDGPDVELGSRNEKPLTRYFPELMEPLRSQLPERCVIDGEIVIVGANGLDFDALSNRIHPAASRVEKLAVDTPASFVAFDVLAIDDRDVCDLPYAERRTLLEHALQAVVAPVHLTPVTTDVAVAADWFDRFEGAGLDGVVAKAADLTYLPDKRAMIKVKHERTADCVVAGFRWHKDGGVVGSLLLGLHDDAGVLHHVGVASSFTAARRLELVDELAPYRLDAAEVCDAVDVLDAVDVAGADRGAEHPWLSPVPGTRVPGGQTRWNAGKDLSWVPLRPELVCEVAFEHLQGDRFRHAARFKRWRPDREPGSCTYAQIEPPVPAELSQVFGARG